MNEASRQFMADLQGKLSQYFNIEEIETLTFVLGIDYDSLRGGTKPTKVNSLISDVARNGRLEELLREVRRLRGNVTWPDMPAGFELPLDAAGSEADGVAKPLFLHLVEGLNSSAGPGDLI